MRLVEFNALDEASAARELRRCCGSTRWVDSMTRGRPFPNAAAMIDFGDAVWASLESADWLEAFAAHPRIGESTASGWEAQEQAGSRSADREAKARLLAGNQQYEARFGYIFIVCATGKSIDTMMETLERRLQNEPRKELQIAAEEQRQITRLRLGKLLEA
jgi:2-oxo-4-hydroxy-4-carboxy-5-ureidoimidazoline decarboxylase